MILLLPLLVVLFPRVNPKNGCSLLVLSCLLCESMKSCETQVFDEKSFHPQSDNLSHPLTPNGFLSIASVQR